MSIKADIEGNLTKDPEGRTVKVDGEARKIVEIRVFSDVHRLVGERYEQDDDKSGGVDVTLNLAFFAAAGMSLANSTRGKFTPDQVRASGTHWGEQV